MKAGRELDCWIEKNVFGNAVVFRIVRGRGEQPFVITGPSGRGKGEPRRMVPEYSTLISAAWQVVEKMGEKGYRFEVSDFVSNIGTGVVLIRCMFFKDLSPEGFIEEADTAPLAICLAAKKSIQMDKEG